MTDSTKAKIYIKRISQYFLRDSVFEILIDEDAITGVNSGETIILTGQPGNHKFSIRSGWHLSNTLKLTVESGKEYNLECGSPLKGWKFLIFFHMLVRPWMWLYLKEV